MRKLNPNIIRVGDKVKIINPELFVRCGYALHPNDEDLYMEISDMYEDKIKRFISDIQNLPCEATVENDINNYIYYRPHINVLHSKILNALCYYEVAKRGFGGRERNIYTYIDKPLTNKIGIVEKIKYCKTGIYTPGYEYGGYLDDEPIWKPPHLSNEKTHKILEVKFGTPFNESISIESINIEKVTE